MICFRGKNRSRFLRYLGSLCLCACLCLCSVTLYAQSQRFRMTFTYGNNPLSALLVLKTEGKLIKGSMLNEFGVNFVTFTVQNGKTKIVHLNPLLKKPFLKKVLKQDFALLTECLSRGPDETVWSSQKGKFLASCVRSAEEQIRLVHQRIPLTIDLMPF